MELKTLSQLSQLLTHTEFSPEGGALQPAVQYAVLCVLCCAVCYCLLCDVLPVLYVLSWLPGVDEMLCVSRAADKNSEEVKAAESLQRVTSALSVTQVWHRL